MQVHGSECGGTCRPTLSEKGDHQSAEDVAAARGGQPGVAGGVDEPVTLRRGDHATAALEDDRGTVAGGEFERCGDPVCLHFGSATTEQASGFGGVRGEHRRRGAGGKCGGKASVDSDEVERVGVE